MAKSGSSAATSGTWQYYKIAVPAGKSKLTVNLTTSQSCGLLGCSPDLDLYVRKAAKPTIVVKFRNESGGTWGGRGKRPQWLRDAINSGKSLSDFAVK